MEEYFTALELHNYWEGQNVKTGFIRHLYIDKLEKYLGNRLIKVLVGQRRTGKSYILRQIIHVLLQKGVNPVNIFYLNMEMIEFQLLKSSTQIHELIQFYISKLKVKGKCYLLIDEVQEIDSWEKLVNSYSQNYLQEFEIFITGSNSKMLSGDLSTYLSGRYVSFEIYPFSYQEFIELNKLTNSKLSFIQYMKFGGLPELMNLSNDETKRNYTISLSDAILLNDVVKRHNVKDIYLLQSLLKYLVHNSGNLVSIPNIVNYLKSNKVSSNYETISNYVLYLCDSFLIHEVERFDVKGKSILSGNKKYYVNDLAFKNYLFSDYNPSIGNQIENIVYIYLKSLGYKVYVGSYYALEIDFIVDLGTEKRYYQICYSIEEKEVLERELNGLKKINDNYEKFLLTLDDISFGNIDGVRHELVWEHLKTD